MTLAAQQDAAPQPKALGPRHRLRAATAQAHERLDRLYSRLDLSRADDYAQFLTSHAAAFIPAEQARMAAGADALVAGWSNGARGVALLADLAALRLPTPPLLPPPLFSDEAAVLGGMYVLEGSRLGGSVLVRQVPAGLPTAFLTPPAISTWRVFTDLLDRSLDDETRFERAVASAQSVFALFERAARATVEQAA